MQDYTNTLPQIARSVHEAAHGFIDEARLNTMVANVQEKCRSLKPGIMLFGFYNAGKSTLLNALLGREVAAVSNIPETKAITEYDYRGYRLFDTPGIDAPIEHERVTREYLEKVEVVIFVISTSDSFEEKASYDDLVKLAQTKKLLVVLNDKQGLSEEERAESFTTVAIRLKKLLPATYNQIPLIFLNAKSALRGRLEGKELLLKASRLWELEEKIAEMMAETGALDAARTTAAMISPIITLAEKAIAERAAAVKGGNLDHLQSTGRADQRLTQLRANGSQLIAQECQNAIQRLRDGIDPETGVDEALANNILTDCNNTITIGLQQLQDEFISETRRDLGVALQSKADSLPANLSDGIPGSNTGSGNSGAHSEAMSNFLHSVNKNSLAKGGFALAKIAGRTANKCSGALKDVLIAFGKTAKGVAKLAGPLAVVVQGIAGIFDITRGYQEDQADYDARVAKIHAMNQHLEHIQRTVRNEFNQAWQRYCDDLRTQINRVADTLKAQDSNREQKLRESLDRLAAAKAALADL